MTFHSYCTLLPSRVNLSNAQNPGNLKLSQVEILTLGDSY